MKNVRNRDGRSFRLTVMLTMIASLLTACGPDGDSGNSGAWHTLTPTIESPLPEVAAVSPQTPTAVAPQMGSTPASALPPAMGDMIPPDSPAKRLTTDQLLTYQPNELGVIPVLQYHVFVTDPNVIDDYTVTIETFNAHLAWLYEHDFYVISMADFIRNEIEAPPGKHPVVLTFDDGTAGQFRFIKASDGTLVPDPDSAVGAMEAFFTRHPDFGRGGFFAILPFNCFAEPGEPDQMPYCERKLTWLAEHGYEVGNHTTGHQDLLDVSDERFMSEIAEATIWIDERVPEPGNLSQMLVVPYGNYPDADTHQEQRRMMREGFKYKGTNIQLEAAFMVGANPAESPASKLWDPIWIARIQTSDAVIDHWFTAFEEGQVILYVSDGSANTITVPDPLPELLEGEFDPDLISRSGKELIQYSPGAQAKADPLAD